MSRFIRLYEKKRGERRTGSKAFGSLGEALFFGTFFVVGCVAFGALFGRFVWPEWRTNRQFAPTTCVVQDKRVGIRDATEGNPAMYRPEIAIRYTVDGADYETSTYDVTGMYLPREEAAQEIVDQFEVGQTYSCWYDPIDPHRVVLVRGYSGWLYVTLLIPLSFIAIGGGALVYTLLHWNASAERRALMVQRTAQLDLFELDQASRSFPNVPDDSNVTNSPGTHLAYRLPIATTVGWTLFVLTTACVLWNGIVAVFVVMAIRDYLQGELDWGFAACVAVFLAGGIGLIMYLVRQIWLATGVGPTRLEISRHPLSPGEKYELFLSQGGRLTLPSLSVALVCEEKASFRQGTDTRTETRRVYENRLLTGQAVVVQQGAPFESRCHFEVPRAGMHSFLSDHNEVHWKLIVHGSVQGRPEFERIFQVVVVPALRGATAS